MRRWLSAVSLLIRTLFVLGLAPPATGGPSDSTDVSEGSPEPGDTTAASRGGGVEAEGIRHRIILTPDAEKIFGMSRSLGPKALVRIGGGASSAIARGVRIDTAGVSHRTDPDSSRGPEDSVRTIPWSRIESLELGHSGWRNGVTTGAKIGATPGAVLVGSAFGENPNIFVSLTVVLGAAVLVVGGVGGAAVGALVGAGIKSWEPIYFAPQVWISAEPGAPPVRLVAVGPIHARSAPILRRDGEMTNAAIDALRSCGFLVVEPDTVLRVVTDQLGRKRRSAVTKWPWTPEMRDALREQTHADALLYGVIDPARRHSEVTRCAFEVSDLASGRTLATAQAAGRESSLPYSQARGIAQDALGHLGELRDPTRSRPDQ